MKKSALFLCAIFILPLASGAIDLKEAKFTQVINDVRVISASDHGLYAAAVNDIFKMPDVLRTGAASRAELVADDKTVTRVGANTIFSYDKENRTIDLQQGSLLFHAPHGKGGGAIHTASATASVIGTTIIVSTTPNGGFKLLDLEGRAEVRFLDDAKERLQPGQMVFVLPGGKHSPIVVFRLDEETKGSALVNGFNTPLDSLPLINEQIAAQTKLIRSGRAVDTGLLAGNWASDNSVQAVSDVIKIPASTEANSIVSGAQLALQTDMTIDSSILDPNNVYLGNGGFNITTDPNNYLGSSLLGNPFFGFPGHDITINTPSVDLSAYAGGIYGNPYFDIVALNNMDIQGSLTFLGLTASDYLYLSAGNQISIPTSATLQADAGLFYISAFQPLTLDNVTVVNNTGDIGLGSPSALTLQDYSSVTAQGVADFYGGNINLDLTEITGAGVGIFADDSAGQTLTMNNCQVSSSGNLDISASSDVNITSSALSATGGPASINSDAGSVNITSTSITANSIILTAGDGILLDSDTFGGTTPTTFSVTAANTATVQNADLSNFLSPTINAHTIVLQNVTFALGSTPVLNSFFGTANFGSVVAGDVNFVSGNTYAGLSIVSTGASAGQINLANTGITIGTSGF